MARKFGSAAAFKTSLEAHLRKRAEERKVPLSTLQLKFVIERLLARLFRNPDPPWLLQGGFAMDVRWPSGSPFPATPARTSTRGTSRIRGCLLAERPGSTTAHRGERPCRRYRPAPPSTCPASGPSSN